MAYLRRSSWTKASNDAAPVKQTQRHVTWHYPGFGNRSVKTAGWSQKRCLDQIAAWRRMHVPSAYREIAYNLFVLPTGDVVEGRGNRQNGANGTGAANRAGMSVQVLIGDDEPLSPGHRRGIAEALALLESWHPGISRAQYPHSRWVSTSCPGPHVRAGIPFRVGGSPKSSPPAPAGPDFVNVDWTQRALTNLGYKPGPVDGKYGDATARAVRAAQQDLGITPADGRPGPATRRALEDAVSKIDDVSKKLDKVIWDVARVPQRTIDAQIPLKGDQAGQRGTLRGLREWYAHDMGQIKQGIVRAQAETLRAITETGKAQGLTDAQVQAIAAAAAEAAARVSAEDVAAHLDVTVKE